MLDPFTALSLAASIAQFVDFGWKVITEAEKIYKQESSTKSMIIGYHPERIASLAKNIKQVQLQLRQQVNDPLSEAEEALSRVAEASIGEARKLETILNQIKLLQDKAEREHATVAGRIKALWPATAAAFKTIWKLESIRDFDRRLRFIRQEVDSHILVVVNAKLDRQDDRIVEVLAVCNQLRSRLINSDGLEEAGKTEMQQHSQDNQPIDDRYILKDSDQLEDLRVVKRAEAVTAILTMSNGGPRTIARRPTDEFINQEDYLNARVMEPQFTFGTADYAEETDNPAHKHDGRDFSRVTSEVVDALHFRTIYEREEVIPDAYSRTFEWIWQDSAENTGNRTNFSNWLKSGRGCYWINGKAGAGKSTLMKYIHQHPEMRRNLQEWCGSKELIIASFFFWRAGSPLQKTQVGLLRSLLFETLDSRRNLVPILFPTLCRTLSTDTIPGLTLSFHELRKAISILLSNVPADKKLFLFIDGIDEYEGDQNEILELFIPNIRTEFVKALISSRPTPVCTDAFEDCPSMRLQDLTVGDITTYVNGKLSDHKLMRRMEYSPDGHGITQQLVQGIIVKASGVFLWVMLVVKSLLTGLRNSDSKKDLLQRLRILPPDLEALYRHMLGSMSLEYQRQASYMIQLVMRSTEIQVSQMSVLQLSFAEEGQPLSALKFPIQCQPADHQAARCKATEGRMRSRCCGLIEGQWLTRSDNAGEMYVGFLHRTVVDFLIEASVYQYLKDLTSDDMLDLNEVLLSSNLKEMKSRPDRALTVNLPNILAYAPCLEVAGSTALSKYIGQMEFVVQHYCYSDPIFYGWAWTEMEKKGVPNLPVVDEEMTLPHPFYMLLAVSGLQHTLKGKIKDEDFRKNDKKLLLLHLVMAFLNGLLSLGDNFDRLSAGYIDSVKLLLDDGQDPNTSVQIGPAFHSLYFTRYRRTAIANVYADATGRVSPWTCINDFLAILPRDMHTKLSLSYLSSLLQCMVNANADLDTVSHQNKSKAHSRSLICNLIEKAELDGFKEIIPLELKTSLKQGSPNKHDSLSPNTAIDKKRSPRGALKRMFVRSKARVLRGAEAGSCTSLEEEEKGGSAERRDRNVVES